jgi:hypothetical protein
MFTTEAIFENIFHLQLAGWLDPEPKDMALRDTEG